MLKDKRYRYLVLVFVLIASLVLVACGDDEDDNGDNGDSGGVELTQTLNTEMGITVQYPEGWAAADEPDASQAIIANSSDVLAKVQEGGAENNPESGEAGILVSVLPMSDLGMAEDTSLDTVFELITQGMTGEGMEMTGDVEDITVNGMDAKRVDIRDTESDTGGFIVGYMDQGAFVMTIVVTVEGETDDFEDEALAVINSMEYAPVAAPAE